MSGDPSPSTYNSMNVAHIFRLMILICFPVMSSMFERLQSLTPLSVSHSAALLLATCKVHVSSLLTNTSAPNTTECPSSERCTRPRHTTATEERSCHQLTNIFIWSFIRTGTISIILSWKKWVIKFKSFYFNYKLWTCSGNYILFTR